MSLKIYVSLNNESMRFIHLACRCSSEVGYQHRLQYISLGHGCWNVGTAAHEIGKVSCFTQS